jgi:3-oxoacyl-[acyl-carrier-protein] synthase II
MNRRVVVTGMAGLSPIGRDWKEAREALLNGRSGVRRIAAWDEIDSLQTRLGAPVEGFAAPSHYPRKRVRAMGRVSLLATRATELG